MAAAVFDHPFLSGLLGDEQVATHFSADADIAAMLAFEKALAQAEAEEGIIDVETADAIAQACDTFAPDMAALRTATARDGVVVPELVRQLRKAIGAPHDDRLHRGATSQDVIDTSLSLRLKPALAILHERLGSLVTALTGLEQRHGPEPLMGRTRMQAAIPISVGDRVKTWRRPLERRIDELPRITDSACRLQFGGPVGTLDKLGTKGPTIRRRLAALLDLPVIDEAWHSQRDGMVELSDWLSLVTGSLGKLGQDVALMAQNGIDEIALSGGGGSSAMAHKHNPVRAEMLVTLARFNAVQVSAMHQVMVHEQERSGATWALEWMILPQMVVATAAALRTAIDLAASVQRIGSASR
ncbi:MAG TPA: 3-carboxy-cis,cis-muconate cycloisomerase [Pararhizobium sp.]|nr:3-carboxy-cis,cis-muconate cycloisomerase [Pararhizobium sp.]